MRPASLFIVLFALTLSVLTFLLVPRLLSRPAEVQAAAPVRIAAGDVLVAARPLPAGTILKASDVRWQRWPEEGLDANFVLRTKNDNAPQEHVGRVVLRGLSTGEPVTAQRVIKPGEAGFLAAALTPGMRAVSVSINVVSGDAGFIVPGDRVDVLLAERYAITYGSSESSSSGTRPSHKTVNNVVLRDVRVLAIDQEVKDLEGKPKVAKTATLEVDLTQAQKLALAPQMGTLSLALRSLARPETVENAGGIVQDVDVSAFLNNLVGKPAGGGTRVYRGAASAEQSH